VIWGWVDRYPRVVGLLAWALLGAMMLAPFYCVAYWF
jgi:hypothetical protein